MRLLPVAIILFVVLSSFSYYNSFAQSGWPEPPSMPSTAFVIADIPYHITDEYRVKHVRSPNDEGFILLTEKEAENDSGVSESYYIIRMFDWNTTLKWSLKLDYVPLESIYFDNDIMGYPTIILYLAKSTVEEIVIINVDNGTVMRTIDLIELFGKHSSHIMSSLYIPEKNTLIMLLNNWTEDYTDIQFTVAAVNLETGELLWKYYEPTSTYYYLPMALWQNYIVIVNSVWNETSQMYDSILYEFNTETGNVTKKIIYSTENETVGIPSPYSEKILLVATKPPIQVTIYDYERNTAKLIEGFNESSINWHNVHWSPDKKHVVLTGKLSDDKYTFRILDVDNSSIVYTTTSDEYEAKKIIYQHDGKDVSAIIPRESSDKLIVFNLTTGRIAFEMGVGPFNDYVWSQNGEKLYVVVTGYRGYPALYVYDALHNYTLINKSIVFHTHHFEKIMVKELDNTPHIYLFDFERLGGDIYIYHLIEQPMETLMLKYQYDAKTWYYNIIDYARIPVGNVKQLKYQWDIHVKDTSFNITLDGYVIPAYYYHYWKSSKNAEWTDYGPSLGILIPVNITLSTTYPIEGYNITVCFYLENQTTPHRIYAVVDPTVGLTTLALHTELEVKENITLLRIETFQKMDNTISIDLLLKIPIENYVSYDPNISNLLNVSLNVTGPQEQPEQPPENTTTMPETTTTNQQTQTTTTSTSELSDTSQYTSPQTETTPTSMHTQETTSQNTTVQQPLSNKLVLAGIVLVVVIVVIFYLKR